MAVNLTKPFQGREYTPTHLMDEEEAFSAAYLPQRLKICLAILPST